MYTLPFSQLSKHSNHLAGGKGASLGEMLNHHIPVPDGFVVLATTFDQFLHATDLTQEIEAILENVDHQAVSSVDKASEKIQALIKHADMPAEIAKEIQTEFKKLDSKFVAVRSSATAEDGAENAWAGQLDSFLNTTNQDLLEKVQHCWASLFTPRAIFYRFEKGLNKTKISVAVVIQKMVNSEKSGIAFSVHPVTEDPNQLIIEAGFGLGEAIVSGQITPDSYVVEKKEKKIIDINISNQDRAIYRKEKGGNKWLDIPDKADTQVLTEKEILELSDIILRIENHYGFPCDIEWAFESNKFYIVQSRPITTLNKNDDVNKIEIKKGIENNSVEYLNEKIDQEKDDFWVLAQEIPKTHIFFFCMAYYMVNWWPKFKLGDEMKELITHFDGLHVRMYCKESEYNKAAQYVANKIFENPKWALNELNRIKLLSDQFIINSELLVKVSKDDNKTVLRQFKKTSLFNLESQVLGAGFTWLTEARYELVTKKTIEIIQDKIKKSGVDENALNVFNVLTKSEKKSHIHNEEESLLKVVRDIQNNSSIEKMFLVKNIAFLVKHVNQCKDATSNQIVDLHRKWCWLSYGYTGPEKKIDEYVEEIKKLISEKTNVVDLEKIKKDNDKKLRLEQGRILSVLKFNKKELGIINFVKESSYIKDYRKGGVYHGMYCYKKFFDVASARYGVESDSFWSMNPFEVENLLENNIKINPELLRKRANSCVLIYKKNDLKIIFDNEEKELLESLVLESGSGNNLELKGTPVCAGRVMGIVKLIESTDDMYKMEKGDILVSQITYPNLLPAMKKAAAIVTNVGGVICHAAIIARELNIPCIVGTKNATKVLKDGDIIEVNANNGIIKIVSK